MTNNGRRGTKALRGTALLLSLAGCIDGASDPEEGGTGRPFGIVAREPATLLTGVDSTLQWSPRFSEYGVHFAVVDSQVLQGLDTLPKPIVTGTIEDHDVREDTKTLAVVIKSRLWADMVEVQFVDDEDRLVKRPPRITMVNDVHAAGADVVVAEIWRDRTDREGDTVRVELARCEPLTVRVIEHVLGPVTFPSDDRSSADNPVGPVSFPADDAAEETRKGFRLMAGSEFTLDLRPPCCPSQEG